MIVRNEAANIERCLASVAPSVDAWVIGDTGSTDDTPERICRLFEARGIPGELHRFPFVDFGQARNEALERCRRSPLAFDYILLTDADMELVLDDPGCFRGLSAPAYLVQQRNVVAYENVRLLRRDASAHYVGVTHEYLHVRGDTDRLGGVWFFDHATGGNREGKFERDARLLEEDLAHDPDNARSIFYLAQSYRDAGRLEDAMAAYRYRAAMGGWAEEAWFSLYQVAKLSEARNLPSAEVEHAYLAAYQARPERAEPLCDLARRHRERGEWALARLYARAAQGIAQPADRLFLSEDVYRWRADDEAAVAASWTGCRTESFALCWSLLDGDRLPEGERPRIEANRDFAAAAVGEVTGQYPREVVARLAAADRRRPLVPGVTLTVTAGRRPHLFETTVNSFLNCCRDVDLVDRFVCIDESSDPADRDRMRERYPFFEFVFKGAGEAGLAHSANLLLDAVSTPYWLHLEDDWHFLVTTDYVGRALSILDQEPSAAQVLFNRNFAETLGDRVVAGGAPRRHPGTGLRYVLHEHVPPGPAQDDALRRLGAGALSSVDRLHFALRPSVLRTEAVRSVGRFEEGSASFEREFSEVYTRRGLRSAFFDTVACVHLGHPGAGLEQIGRPSFRSPNEAWRWS